MVVASGWWWANDDDGAPCSMQVPCGAFVNEPPNTTRDV
jgi:hypothetical protein